MSSDSKSENDVGATDPVVAPPAETVETDQAQVNGWQERLQGQRLEWLHPSSLLFSAIALGRAWIVPAVIGLLSAARGSVTGVMFSIAIFLPAILTAVFKYLTLRYTILDDKLIVMRGLIFRRIRTIPVDKIQNIDLVQNPLHRLMGVAEVRIETASGTDPEAVLRVLSLDQVETLRAGIASRLPQAGNAAPPLSPGLLADPVPADMPESPGEIGVSAPPLPSQVARSSDQTREDEAETELLRIPANWLVRAGLASNRGVLLFGFLVYLANEFQLWDRLDAVNLEDWIPQNWDLVTRIAMGVCALLGIVILLRLVSVGWFLLRFFDYRLTQRDQLLRLSCGLLTRVSATVPVQRIQFISIHQNLLMRWMRLASIRIETAGGAGKENEDAAATVARRWFVPVIPMSRVAEIVSRLHPDLELNLESLDWKSLAPRATYRMCRLATVLAVLLGAGAFGIWRPWGWMVSAIALPAFLAIAIRRSRSRKYARTDYGLVYRSGIWTRKTSITFFEKIQAVRMDQNPLDRRWRMATLSVDTAAAGPADHRIDVAYLDQGFVEQEFAQLRVLVSKRRPRFS